jgi:hypothetical protein
MRNVGGFTILSLTVKVSNLMIRYIYIILTLLHVHKTKRLNEYNSMFNFIKSELSNKLIYVVINYVIYV